MVVGGFNIVSEKLQGRTEEKLKISVIIAGSVFENKTFGHLVSDNRNTQNAYLGEESCLLGHHAVEYGES
jgi:hypothetical protein